MEILLTQLLVQMGSPMPPDGLAAAANTSTLPSALWFLSLVLSLSTSAVGIVALQWLREHERPYGGIEPQIAVSLHRMQAKSLDEWFVPQIFAILPMALQTALVLFLIGLTISMWHMNRTVAIFVIVAVGFTLFFLLATTVLPALQSLFLLLPIQIGKKPRSPCPYRSPQSWIFHRLISAIVRVVRYILKINWDNYSKIDSRNLTSAEGRSGWNGDIPHGTGLLFRNKAKDSWLEHGVAWLFQRDFEFMPSGPRGEEPKVYSERPIPLYDAVHALLDAKQAEFSHSTITAIDYCLDDVVKANVKGEKNHYARFLHQLSIISPLEYAHGLPKHVVQSGNPDLNVLQEDATLRLFSRRVGFSNLPSGAALKTIEICLRLTGWMYGENEARLCPTGPNSSSTRSWIPVQWAAQMILASTDIDESIIEGKVVHPFTVHSPILMTRTLKCSTARSSPPHSPRLLQTYNGSRFLASPLLSNRVNSAEDFGRPRISWRLPLFLRQDCNARGELRHLQRYSGLHSGRRKRRYEGFSRCLPVLPCDPYARCTRPGNTFPPINLFHLQVLRRPPNEFQT